MCCLIFIQKQKPRVCSYLKSFSLSSTPFVSDLTNILFCVLAVIIFLPDWFLIWHWPNIIIMLGQYLWRCPSINTAPGWLKKNKLYILALNIFKKNGCNEYHPYLLICFNSHLKKTIIPIKIEPLLLHNSLAVFSNCNIILGISSCFYIFCFIFVWCLYILIQNKLSKEQMCWSPQHFYTSISKEITVVLRYLFIIHYLNFPVLIFHAMFTW